ncbi:MAG: extracellular solute-binding protein [Paracholeplasma sp.]|nr:extracellular solute-binding protein [Paracholeplasma sp.]MDY3195527.1 extracellular solute-binding protein [Paracholeplasma sp.]
MKKVVLVLLSITLTLSLAACGKKKADSGKERLVIAFAEAGYGRGWLENLEAAFEAENENVDIILDGNPNMTANAGPKIESGRDLADIYFLLETNWQRWATRGYLEPLDDLYEMETEPGVTLEDKLIDEVVEFGRIGDNMYALPWNDGVTGLVYNSKMFRDKGWEVPETVNDLIDLTEQIKTEGAGVKPFTWPGQYSAYWNFVVYGWWAQYEGLEAMNEFYQFESPEVFKQEGKLKALEAYETLIGDQSNSTAGVNGLIHTQAQMQFINGFAAMIPNGLWIESEMKAALPAGFEMKMMPIPTIEGAKEPKINNSMLGDFIVVPKQARNKELAKEFLRFMAEDKQLLQYTKDTGTPRPFEYDPTTIEGLSPFILSALEIWKNSKSFYIISKSPLYYGVYVNTFPKSGAPYGDIYLGEESAESVWNGDYQYVFERWDEFKRNAGMTD